ncbi:hypothetical protein [Sapientia aquatica]|jgi:hypothetical protein|uniref:Uncharacterized protein n=1 Tax=Sapientia aquatica TaxID=1549640 RepID=A0A4R5VWK6_9BURK|nr:hypothetical protein [Sapientia aquatica]TDK63566.1 hypothetical protein E2I14_15305 [Sapientia aquatica]
MAVYADRVRETTTTTGTGTYSLGGAVTGFITFVSGVTTGQVVTYCAEDGTNWEVGEGTITSGAPDTLTRTTILASSNAGGAVSWSVGSKNIFLTASAVRVATLDKANTFTGKVGAPSFAMTNGGLSTVTYTSSTTTANQIIDSVLTASVLAVKYLVHVVSGSSYQAGEILILHDGVTPSICEYGDINTGSVLATFDATIATGNLNLVFTPTNAVTTVKVIRTSIGT